MTKLKMLVGEVVTFLLGVSFCLGAGYVIYGQVESGRGWSMWPAAVSLALAALGLFLIRPNSFRHLLSLAAPYFPFLEEPDADGP